MQNNEGWAIPLRQIMQGASAEESGEALYELAQKLYPICRSITGPGVRQTLDVLSNFIDLSITEIRTGTDVFDWTIPNEWSVKDAYIASIDGQRLIDFHAHSLHVLNYSAPFKGRVTMEELRPHLHTLPDQPDLIPYRTSYYNEKWGFCLSQKQLERLGDGPFDVEIDSTLAPGSLSIAEAFIPGTSEEEILISAHMCHPSLANDNLSGIVIATALALRAQARPLRHGLRILFIPGTIGSIAWLAANEERTPLIAHGLVLTGLGDKGALTYKMSRRGQSLIDKAATHVLAHRHPDNKVIPFSPWGYDERQFCSPGFNLPVGRLSRTPHGEYPEYHTSGDNLSFISGEALGQALAAAEEIISIVDNNAIYLSTNPKGEPRLGKRGLYRQTAGQGGALPDEIALLWVLNLADGKHSLLETAEKSGLRFNKILAAADALHGVGLLELH
jgi:aminopeptidase-like protein